ncbi:hypothetical protein BH23BAC1_BH23BAC1_00950 [soil metagenome]
MEGKPKKVFMNIRSALVYFFSFILLFVISACDRDHFDNELPYAYVEITINTNNLQYDDLRIRGFTYISGGLRGIVILRDDFGNLKAFDRACPFQPENPCGLIEVAVSRFHMLDPCCNSTFNLQGIPTGGPAINRMREYFTFVDGDFLTISSEPF